MSTYLISTLYFLIIWIFLFLYKGNKKEQLTWSLVGSILGPMVETLHRIDWWKPNYIADKNFIHLEDILFGFLRLWNYWGGIQQFIR